MKKKFMMLLFAFIFIPVVAFADDTFYENYFGIEMNEEEYNNLLQLGFSENEIYHMERAEFNKNKDLKAKLEEETTNYYVNITRYDATGRIASSYDMQIPKEDYEKYASGQVASPLDIYSEVGTEYKLMRTTVSKNGNYYRYKVSLDWQKMPKVRSYDIIGIGYEPMQVYRYGDVNYHTVYCDSSSCKVDYSYNHLSENPGGQGVSFAMPTSTKVSEITSTLYFDVTKYPGEVVESMGVYGDYSHAVKTIPSDKARLFVLNQSGVYIYEDAYDYYDQIRSADVYWYGTW